MITVENLHEKNKIQNYNTARKEKTKNYSRMSNKNLPLHFPPFSFCLTVYSAGTSGLGGLLVSFSTTGLRVGLALSSLATRLLPVCCGAGPSFLLCWVRNLNLAEAAVAELAWPSLKKVGFTLEKKDVGGLDNEMGEVGGEQGRRDEDILATGRGGWAEDWEG